MRAAGFCFLFPLAWGSSYATYGLWTVGQKNNWSSDGPGMLFVMLALAVCAIVALCSWLGVASLLLAPGED